MRLQLLLKPEHRRLEAGKDVAQLAQRLGFEVSGIGRASVSVTVNVDQLRGIFGEDVQASARELPVPPLLEPYVESITVAPRHEYL